MAVGKHISWNEILRLSIWTPLSATGIATEDLSEDVKKIGEQKYLFVVRSDFAGREERAPYVTLAIWAETDGAALRAADGQMEADTVSAPDTPPPSILLPAGALPGYSSILAGLRLRGDDVLETAEYRIATDGAFLHKVVRAGREAFYFGSDEILPSEKPFAITYRLQE